MYKECVKGYMYLIIRFEYRIVVGSSSIHVIEYKFVKVASMLNNKGSIIEALTWRKVDKEEKLMTRGAVWSKDVPFAIDAKGERGCE